MKPSASWEDFRRAMKLQDHPRLRAIFLGGFAAGMGHVGEFSLTGRQQALEEIKSLLDQARQEDCYGQGRSVQ